MGQQVIYGLRAIKDLLCNKKIMLVKGCAFDLLELKGLFTDFSCVEFSGFTPNPLYEQVCEGVRIYNQEDCEMIVAVGGGSAIDVAKCIKLFCGMDSSVNYLNQEMVDSKIPLIAVPTTAGTGSESTKHAVIYFDEKKQSISHPSIIPDYAVLDASVLKSLPVYQKKCTMLDALGQAIESWWSINSNDESKNYSRIAVKKIKENWEMYIFDNSDYAAKEMLFAANYAGRAIDITATTAPHAMSYKLTSLFGIPHGHAVALCLREVWQYMKMHKDKCIDQRGEKYFWTVLKEIESMIGHSFFVDMLKQMEIGSPISKDKEEDLRLLVKSVNVERLKNNPVLLKEEDLNAMYRRIVEG